MSECVKGGCCAFVTDPTHTHLHKCKHTRTHPLTHKHTLTYKHTLTPAQQNLKDSIVVTSAGAEVLPFLEAYGVLPASLLFFMFYKQIVRACVCSVTCN